MKQTRLFFYLAFFCLRLAVVSASAFTAKDVNAMAAAYNSAFYVQSGTNGWIKDTQSGGISYFWTQAEIMECMIDAYERNSNSITQMQITNLLNGFIKNNGSVWTSYTPYNDDVMWAVLAFARGGVDTGQTNYCNLAKANFDACYARAYDTKLGGGLYWLYPNNASKNACVNGPGAVAAYLLYRIYGDTNYFNKATNLYAWERSTLFNTNSGSIADNIGTNGVVVGGPTTYNQGTFLGAAHFLGQTNDANLIANFTMMNMTSGGILPEYGIHGNNSGFNAIFLRWLVRFMKDRQLQAIYEPWLQTNATAAWNLRRASDDLSWCQWLHPTATGTNFSSWDCISSYEILQAADPTQGAATQSVPLNPNGYYPLDAASGTLATDITGGGNNGVVNNATWNAGGRFNGCLTFNGSNSSVSITNPVGNDFSISFWVKTTQTGGTPNWYNGAGLVDGDVSGSANDFGTSLVGGHFACGIGNPDTTITSAATINNGAWHHCAATRQQATGIVNLYVDGSLQGSGIANRNTLNGPAKLAFGAIASGNGFFNGSLDEVKFFNRTLTAGEVAALYANSTVVPTVAPTNLVAVAVAGNAQVQLSWADAALATSYNVKRSLVVGGPYTFITNVASTSYTDLSLANNHTYYYVVSAVNVAGVGSDSAPANASPLALAAWFKADALTNLANGAHVSFWVDTSGNGFNAIQPTATSQPTFVTGAVNGMPAVRFNSANNSYLWFYRPVQDDFTMIFVFQSNQGLTTGTSFYSGAGLINGEVAGTANDFGLSLNANGQILAGTGNADVTVHSSSGYNNGIPHVVTFRRTKSSGALALYVDGGLVAAGTGGTQSLTSPNQLVLGAEQTLNNFLSGDIAEVQIYSAALADADRIGQENALKCKYNIGSGATPSAPVGFTVVAGNRKIALDWTLSAGAAAYNLWRSTDGGSSYQLIAPSLITSSYVDTNAANGQINYYKVTGLDACGAGAYSAVANVVLSLPVLNLSLGANSLTLQWPGWASDWTLYNVTNLTPPVFWSPVTNAANTNGNQLNLSFPVNSDARFFRLSYP